MAGYKRWGPVKPRGGFGYFPSGGDMSIEDLGGEVYGDLEILFHHPLETFKDYHIWVNDDKTLCRGSWPDKNDLFWLKQNDINIVVNLCEERDQDVEVRMFAMEPINISIKDTRPPTIDDAVLFFRLTNIPTNKIYIHCEAGHGRTGCMCAYYRVIVDKWTPQRALQEALFIAGGKLGHDQQKWILDIH